MDMDSKKNGELPYVDLMVSIFLKIEVAAVFLFLVESPNTDRVFFTTIICAVVNQFTEMLYFRKTTLRQRLLLLFNALLVFLGVLLAFLLSTTDFTRVWHGETMIDKVHVWAVVKLMLVFFLAFGLARLFAVFADYFFNWDERRRQRYGGWLRRYFYCKK